MTLVRFLNVGMAAATAAKTECLCLPSVHFIHLFILPPPFQWGAAAATAATAATHTHKLSCPVRCPEIGELPTNQKKGVSRQPGGESLPYLFHYRRRQLMNKPTGEYYPD